MTGRYVSGESISRAGQSAHTFVLTGKPAHTQTERGTVLNSLIRVVLQFVNQVGDGLLTMSGVDQTKGIETTSLRVRARVCRNDTVSSRQVRSKNGHCLGERSLVNHPQGCGSREH